MVGMNQPALQASMEAALRAQQRLSSKYKHVFSGQAAEEVLADLARYTMVDGEPFAAGQADQTAYNLGKQAVYRYIQKRLKEQIQNGSGE